MLSTPHYDIVGFLICLETGECTVTSSLSKYAFSRSVLH